MEGQGQGPERRVTGPIEITEELLDDIGIPTVTAAGILLIESQVEDIVLADMRAVVESLQQWPEENRALFVGSLDKALNAIEDWASNMLDELEDAR